MRGGSPVSVKRVFDGSGNPPSSGDLSTEAQIRDAFDRANEMLEEAGRGVTARLRLRGFDESRLGDSAGMNGLNNQEETRMMFHSNSHPRSGPHGPAKRKHRTLGKGGRVLEGCFRHQAVRFPETAMRSLRTIAIGVVGFALGCGDSVTSPQPDQQTVAIVTATGGSGADPALKATNHVVYPTGEYPTDVMNVQAAVDQGGTILLKATDLSGRPQGFNFGSSEHGGEGSEVTLQMDVSIRGETVGSRMTTIDGGWLPFYGIAHRRTAIAGINFEGQGLSAMVFIKSSGAVIRDNRVAGVVGTPLPPEFGGLLEGRGIKFLGNNDPQGAITGKIIIAGNVIEDMDAGLADGIVFDFVAADVAVVGNRVETTQSSALLMVNSSGRVKIADNEFTVLPGGEFLYGNGIAILAGVGDSYRIENNRIVAEGLLAEGIFIASDEHFLPGAVVDDLILRRNHVSLSGSVFGGITLLGDVTDARVTSNRVDGDGALAFDLLSDGLVAPRRTRATKLDASGFEATLVNVFLDVGTARNLVVGRLGSVEDLGEGNKIVDVTARAKRPPASHGPEVLAGRSDKTQALERMVETLRSSSGPLASGW